MKVGFDTLGKYDVNYPLPRQAPKIFTLCTNFLIKEDNSAASARTVYTEDIRALLTQSGAAQDQQASGESQRALSSEEVKALDKKAVALIQKIHRTMLYEFAESPAEATAWGFDIKQTGRRAGLILMPDGRAAIVKVLAQYAKVERARPAADRFKLPALSDVEAVVDGLSTNLNTRGTGQSQRVAATQQTSTLPRGCWTYCKPRPCRSSSSNSTAKSRRSWASGGMKSWRAVARLASLPKRRSSPRPRRKVRGNRQPRR